MTTTDDTPWYVEHCNEPKGPYHTSWLLSQAARNPENRQGTVLHHHSEFAGTDIQDAISQALRILKEAPDRVFLLGGDLPSGSRRYYHVKWDTDEEVYQIVQEGSRERTRFPDQQTIREALFDRFPDDSFVFPVLIHTENSPFILNEPEPRDDGSTIVAAA